MLSSVEAIAMESKEEGAEPLVNKTSEMLTSPFFVSARNDEERSVIVAECL